MRSKSMRMHVSYIFAVLVFFNGGYGTVSAAETENLWAPAFRPSDGLWTLPLQKPDFHLWNRDTGETDALVQKAQADEERKEMIADQISYGYLHGIVLAAFFAAVGASVSQKAFLIGGGFGMAVGSGGAVYAIGEKHTDFDRDNLFELPLFRVMDGGGLGLATFGGALVGLGVFSPITATIAYHTFKPHPPAIVHVEDGHIQFGLPAVGIQVSRLSWHQPETDFTTRFIQVRF